MSPPIFNPDGTEVSEIVLPDGSTASQVIGPDGNAVFEAGPDIPDSGMFQDPLYQWTGMAIEASDGTSPVDWPESLAGLADASAVGGPTKQTQGGLESVLYDGNDDAHEWTPDSQLPTGSDSFSMVATIYLNSLPSTSHAILYYGNQANNEFNGFRIRGPGVVSHWFFANDLDGSTTVSTGQWITVGVRYDGSNRKLYLNGSGDGNDSPGSVNVQDQSHTIGYLESDTGQWFDGYIHDIVLCGTAESDQAFADYHNDRVP